MFDQMMMDYKFYFFQVAPPIYLIGFTLFSRFMLRRFPKERKAAWLLITIGGYAAIIGLMVAVYLHEVELGAKIIMGGWILGVIGTGWGLSIFLK